MEPTKKKIRLSMLKLMRWKTEDLGLLIAMMNIMKFTCLDRTKMENLLIVVHVILA